MMVDLLAVSSFKPGNEVIKEGTEGDSMYIVAGGGRECVSVCVSVYGCMWGFYLKPSHDILNDVLRLSDFIWKPLIFQKKPPSV